MKGCEEGVRGCVKRNNEKHKNTSQIFLLPLLFISLVIFLFLFLFLFIALFLFLFLFLIIFLLFLSTSLSLSLSFLRQLLPMEIVRCDREKLWISGWSSGHRC